MADAPYKFNHAGITFHVECNGEELFEYFGCNESGVVISMPEDEMIDLYSNCTIPLMIATESYTNHIMMYS